MQKKETVAVLNNLEGLDLELSQSRRGFDFKMNKNVKISSDSGDEDEETKSKMIKKGALLDGLDLNTGYDMYQ